MSVPPCILTLLLVYPPVLAAGVWFYRYLQRTKPKPFPDADRRNRFVKIWRLAVFVVLLPLALVLSVAVLGWLDPLFFIIRDSF